MDKLDHLGWVVSSSYAIGDVRFAVRSTSPAFGAWLSEPSAPTRWTTWRSSCTRWSSRATRGWEAKEFCILYKGSSAILRTLDPVTLGRGLLAELEGLGLHERTTPSTYGLDRRRAGPDARAVSLAPGLAKLGRRAAKLGVGIPGELTSPSISNTASVVPSVRSTCPADALERLAVACPWKGRDGLRFVERPRTSQRSWSRHGPEAPLHPHGRDTPWRTSPAGRSTWRRSAAAVSSALGRFVERTPCYGSAWTDTAEADRALRRSVKEGS